MRVNIFLRFFIQTVNNSVDVITIILLLSNMLLEKPRPLPMNW